MFGKKYKVENEQLKSKIAEFEALMTPELADYKTLLDKTVALQSEFQNYQNLVAEKKSKYQEFNRSIRLMEQEIISLEDEILLQDFGVYRPTYDFANSEKYKEKLSELIDMQKHMIRDNRACIFPTNFTYNNSKAKGAKLVKDNVKQILYSFNNECTVIIDKVKFNNVEVAKNKIQSTCNRLNKMNSGMGISIVPEYLDLKLKELSLAYEYTLQKQKEKEEEKAHKAQLREEAKLQKEIEEARKLAIKEQQHYINAQKQLEKQLLSASEDEAISIKQKLDEVNLQLGEATKSIEDIDYRAANKRAGYVYIISNIGAFGENVYKIGMTRRLEPMDRVSELGDASVPFNFDLHAMIFSDDAPSLENALHKAFDEKRLNAINQRREFFNVTLQEIEDVVKANFDETIDFVKIPPAEQYRETLMLKKSNRS